MGSGSNILIGGRGRDDERPNAWRDEVIEGTREGNEVPACADVGIDGGIDEFDGAMPFTLETRPLPLLEVFVVLVDNNGGFGLA